MRLSSLDFSVFSVNLFLKVLKGWVHVFPERSPAGGRLTRLFALKGPNGV